MERMTEKKIGKRKVKVHRMEGLYPYVRLEDFMQVCKGLEEENKNLEERVSELKKEVERLQKVLYTITGSRDDGEPDLYEDVEGDLC